MNIALRTLGRTRCRRNRRRHLRPDARARRDPAGNARAGCRARRSTGACCSACAGDRTCREVR